MIDNRPDLPELESVELRNFASLWSVGFLLAFLTACVGMFIWLYLTYRQYLGPHLPVITFLIALAVLMVLLVTIRVLASDYHWKTDAQGLTTRGILRRRFAKWSEFTAQDKASGEHYYRLRTIRGTVSIPMGIPYAAWRDDVLFASIWQHLRRCGKADGLDLSESASSLWDEIPDAVPHEIRWDNPHPRRWIGSLVSLAVVTVMFGALGLPMFLAGNYALGTMSIVMMGMVLALNYPTEMRPGLLTPMCVVLDDDGITALFARRSVRLPWSEVTRAAWISARLTGDLLLRGDTPHSEMVIPLDPKNDDSCMLVLAIIRRLRAAGVPPAVPIPKALRSFATPIRELSPNPVELRSTLSERIIYSVMGLMCGNGLAMMPTNGHTPGYIAGMGALAGGLAAWFGVGAYRVHVTDDGISKRVLFWEKHVSWDEVKGIKLYTYGRRAMHPTIQLLDCNGRLLMDTTFGVGTHNDLYRVQTAIGAHLARILPPEQLDKPWKSRPWTQG